MKSCFIALVLLFFLGRATGDDKVSIPQNIRGIYEIHTDAVGPEEVVVDEFYLFVGVSTSSQGISHPFRIEKVLSDEGHTALFFRITQTIDGIEVSSDERDKVFEIFTENDPGGDRVLVGVIGERLFYNGVLYEKSDAQVQE